MTISVVIPTYNRVHLLAEAVESVLGQEVPGAEIEVIIVDDGSTDSTHSYLADLKRRPLPQWVRVRTVSTDHNGMPGQVRNRGVAASTGTLVAFLDSDDLWLPGKLAAQLELHTDGRELSHTREIWLRSGKEISQASQSHTREEWVFPDALRKCIIGPSTTMITSSLFHSVGGFREDIEIAEDYELWLRLTCRTPVAYLDEPYTVKRAGHGEQLSEKHGQIEIFRITALKDLVDRGFFAGVASSGEVQSAESLARVELARKLSIYATGCRKRGRNGEAARFSAMAAHYQDQSQGEAELTPRHRITSMRQSLPKRRYDMNVGIIGCGNISSIYLENLNQKFSGVTVRAVADIVPEKAKARAEEYSVQDALTVEQLISHPEIDLVLNLTVPNAHADVSRAALEAGKHTYSEKPLAVDFSDGVELVALAKKKGLRLGAAPDTFLGGGLQTVRKLVDDGWVGNPVAATAFFMGHGPESWHPSPHSFYKKGAGPLFDMGPYYITALIHLLGPVKQLSAATRISSPERIATSDEAYGERIGVEVPTFVAGTLEFASGAVATIVTSFDVWRSKLPRIELYGELGTVAVPDPNTFGGPVELFRSGAEEWGDVPLSHGFSTNSRGIGVLDIATAVDSDRPHRASAEMSLHVLEVMQGLIEAGEGGTNYEMTTTCERPAPLPLGLGDRTIE